MRRETTTLRTTQTVGQAIESLRGAPLAEKIVYFYVVDRDERLVGVVPTRRLLMSRPEAAISEIMVNRVISIPDGMTLLDACEFFVLHRLLAFPVVDDEMRLLGVVDVNLFTDEIFGVAERQSAEDMFQLIGVHVAAARRATPLQGFKTRFPWLLCNIGGGLACALLAAWYEDLLGALVVIAVFIPVVLALAESVSIQSMSLTIQSLHGDGGGWRTLAPRLLRELLTALLLGAASGAIVALVTWLWRGAASTALAIGASIFASMVTACALGVVLPSLARAARIDPRIAAGPIVLATADVLTLLLYFNIAATLLRG